MKLHKSTADIFVPDGLDVKQALERTTHLGIGAHQDDLEFGAVHGALECFGLKDRWFTGITCTDGAGSSRTGVYADYTNDDMKAVRREEQRTAALIGKYAAVCQLDYSSREVKAPEDHRLEEDILQLLKATRPEIVYTHNPADKHSTHVAVMLSAVRAMKALPADERPEKVYGCEGWRSLDWLPDSKKVVLDVGCRDNLLASLMGVFDSQIAGGKRYDAATLGRFKANATYLESHGVDQMNLALYAIDLTPVVHNDDIDVIEYVTGLIDEFRQLVEDQIKNFI